MLQKPQHQQGQELHVLGNDELRAGAAAGRRHRRLVDAEDVDQLVDEGVPSVLQLVRQGALDGLVGQQRGQGDLVDRAEDFGHVGCSGNGLCDNADSALACGQCRL
jgi:hypothetical protein